MKKVLIVIDMQNDFITGSLGTKEAQAIVPAVEKRCREAKASGEGIIFTQDTHGDDYLSTQEGRKLPVAHCIKGTPGWEICDALLPYAEKCVEKPTFGSVELMKLCADYDAFELCGLCTDICVISNAMLLKAYYPEKEVSVDADLCAGVTPESHENALSAMQMCQINIER
ncbi:MAG: isochorismatase family cysteine hydrolase [Eubacteriales bacterium]|nr:isochorismatase family cysteine hydrolase [Eubacteriales bacterium]